MIIIFVFSKNQKSQYTNKIIQKFKRYLPFFYPSFECVSARNRNFTRSLYLSFLENGCSTLEVVSLDRRYARYDAESIGAKVWARWKSRKSIKGIGGKIGKDSQWVSERTSFGGHVSVALATTSSVAWLEPLAVWQNNFHRSYDLTILYYKEFSSTSSSRLFLLYQFDDTGAFVRLGNFRIKFSTIIIKIFN